MLWWLLVLLALSLVLLLLWWRWWLHLRLLVVGWGAAASPVTPPSAPTGQLRELCPYGRQLGLEGAGFKLRRLLPPRPPDR